MEHSRAYTLILILDYPTSPRLEENFISYVPFTKDLHNKTYQIIYHNKHNSNFFIVEYDNGLVYQGSE